MGRAIPLRKLVLRMTVFGLALGLVEYLLETQLPWFGFAGGTVFRDSLALALKDGLVLGLALGLSMAFYARVLHRRVTQPALFRLALVIIGVAGSLALVQEPFHPTYLFHELGPLSGLLGFAAREPWMYVLLVLTLIKHLAIGLMSLYVAGLYLRDGGYLSPMAVGQQAAQSREA